MTFLTLRSPGHWEAIFYAVVIISICWLASAIGLFFKSPLAWYGSLACSALMLCGSLALFFMSLIQQQSESTGYAFVFGFIGFAIFLADAAGLVYLRKTT
jgi:hypothetical protein